MIANNDDVYLTAPALEACFKQRAYKKIEGLKWKKEGLKSWLQSAGACEDYEDVALNEDLRKMIHVRLEFNLEKESLVQRLMKNLDIFAWHFMDMPGIDSQIGCHCLNPNSATMPMKQKKCPCNNERAKITAKEVDQLLQANFIKLVKYPEQLTNVVVVSKKSGDWRVGIDLWDVNKACSKDSFS